LKFFHPHLVELAAIDHFKNLQRTAVGASALESAFAGHELWWMAQRLGDLIGRLRAAVDQDQLAPFFTQRDDVVNDGVDIQFLAAADLNYQHFRQSR